MRRAAEAARLAFLMISPRAWHRRGVEPAAWDARASTGSRHRCDRFAPDKDLYGLDADRSQR